MGYLIRNWSTFQHFKDRRPPWIKLHRDILDQRDINALSDRDFRVLIGLWLLASEDRAMQGALPCVDDICFRLRMDKSSVVKALQGLDKFLIQDDNTTLSPRYHGDDPETETETETEAEVESRRKPRVSKPSASPDDLENLRLAWNSMAETCGLPLVRGYGSPAKSNTRINNAKARLADLEWLTAYPSALERIPLSESMTGKKPPSRGYETPWRMTFDQFVRAETVTKILEGLHDDRKAPDMYQGPEVDWSTNVRINGAGEV